MNNKESIANYKGVMLCNRPNEPMSKPDNETTGPFISRVTVPEQLGLNPTKSFDGFKKQPKRKLEILKKHKLWLQQLQKQKEEQFKKLQEKEEAENEKKVKIKEKAADRRKKLQGNSQQLQSKSQQLQVKEGEVSIKEDLAPSKRLTEKNLKLHEKKSSERNRTKPEWAKTEAEIEKEEEEEVEDLLDFAKNLDYESFINDLEVKQALEVVKQRIDEINQEKQWKQKIADTYNKEETKSVNSVGSLKSLSSKAASQLSELKSHKSWNKSVKSEEISATSEERVAKLVADEVLNNYPKFKSIHSNASVRKLLEQEAKKQMKEPVISTIKEEPAETDPSNLPYLHRNPAI